MNNTKSAGSTGFLGVRPQTEPFMESEKLNGMLRRFTDLVNTAATSLGVKSGDRSFSIYTGGWECRLYFVITESCPSGAAACKRPFLGDLLGREGPMWKPIIEMARNFGFRHLGEKEFLDLTTGHFLRATT